MSNHEILNEISSRLSELERDKDSLQEQLDNVADYEAGLEKRLDLLEDKQK